MPRLFCVLPFVLLPLTLAVAHEEHIEHGSLGAHEHGAATLNLALDGNMLDIQLESPAMNIVGFEHSASSAKDQARVAAARALLLQPLQLFGLPAEAACSIASQHVESPLFEAADQAAESQHSDVDADYQFTCVNPAALEAVDLDGFFTHFPGTRRIAVQLIGPSGQQGVEADATNTLLRF
jgi:hypothetical protein